MATPTTLPASFTAGQVLTAAQMDNLRGAFRILQLNSTCKTDSFTTTSTTFTDVTGFTISITPSSATSKILVYATMATSNGSGEAMQLRLMRDSTAIAIGDVAGSRTQATTGYYNANADNMNTTSMSFLDSPATTSATTYKVQIRATGGGNLMCVNRSSTDTNAATTARGVSTITVFEVSA